MPTAVTLPSCLMDCYKVLYPKLDFSRVAFYSGLPTGISSPAGFTMASGAASPDIRVYIKDYDPYNPCDEETFLTIAHELVHVIQIQGMFGSGYIPGSWTIYYMSHFLGCAYRGSECDNLLEREAYDFANAKNETGYVYCGTEGKLRQYVDTTFFGLPPCDCSSEPWPIANTIGSQTYAGALQAAPDLVKTKSDVGRVWCALFTWPVSLIAGVFSIFGFSNTGGAWGAAIGTIVGAIAGGWEGFVFGAVIGGPLGAAIGLVIGVLLGALIGGLVGGAIGWAIDEIGSWIGGLFSGPSAGIWFTAFDGNNWVIPDIPVTQNGHSLTSDTPTMANFGGKLYLAYRGNGSDNSLWYNTFDGHSWLAQDLEITKNGHSQTSTGPAIAEYNGKLYLAYRGAGDDSLWYNVYDGNGWLDPDLEITKNGHSKTSAGPALAAFNGKLYLAYRGSGDDSLWYNVFDGNQWLDPDLEITKNGHSKTSDSPALAAYNGMLYLAYRGSGDDSLWYNVFDGNEWLDQDIEITKNGHSKAGCGPALGVYNGLLYLAYQGSGSDDIWYNVFNGSWLDQDIKISSGNSVKTGRGPTLAVFNPYLFMAYRDNS
jgi:hypothetical protein